MEQPVPQSPLEQAEQQGLDQLGAIEAGVAHGSDVVDADALDALHGQDPRAGQVPVHRSTWMFLPNGEACMWDTQASIDCASRRKSSSSARLSAKSATTSCARQSATQLGQLDQLRAPLEDLQVGGDAATDARPLDLDDDLFAAVQGRVVHLRDQRRRERLFVEALEQRFAARRRGPRRTACGSRRSRRAAPYRAGCGTPGTAPRRTRRGSTR